MRGKQLDLTRKEAVGRALGAVGTCTYKLGAGGKDPCHGSPGGPEGFSDCSGFVCWALGIDRFQPAFPVYGGWISTDSILESGVKGDGWFKAIPLPTVGCLVVFPGIDEDRNGKRERIGHVGMVTSVPAEYDPIRIYSAIGVVQCHGPSGLHPAITKGDGHVFAGRRNWQGHSNSKWGARFVDYQRFT